METKITIRKQANAVLNPFIIRNKSKALQLATVFKPMTLAFENLAKEIDSIKEDYKSGFTKEIGDRAREVRLQLVTIRTTTEKLKTSEKAEYLLATKAIDGLNNIIKMATTLDELDLKEIETHEQRAEAVKIETLQAERADKIRDYVENPDVLKLGEMDGDIFDAYFSMKKNKKEALIKEELEIEKLRLKKIAEAEAERKAQAEENARLKAEAIKTAAAQKVIDQKLKDLAEKAKAAALVVANKLKAIEEEKARVIKEAKDKAEEAARASDGEKIQSLAYELNMIIESLPDRGFLSGPIESQIKTNLQKTISSLYEIK
jgi:hypothetical protein